MKRCADCGAVIGLTSSLGSGAARPPALEPIAAAALVGGPAVAKALVGQWIVRRLAPPIGLTFLWRVSATEYYGDLEGTEWFDPASYATRRLAKGGPMFGPPGRVFIAHLRGQYWSFNSTAEPASAAGAIMITAAELVFVVRPDGNALELSHVVEGPQKVRAALYVHGGLEGADLSPSGELFFAAAAAPTGLVAAGPRIGIRDEWNRPWRFHRAPRQ